MPGEAGEVTSPHEAVPQRSAEAWGYTQDDIPYYLTPTAGFYYDDRPPWDVPTPSNPSRFKTVDGLPPYDAPQKYSEAFRARLDGARRLFRGKAMFATYAEPTETVSEGWLNKINAGPIARAKPSSPEQYERQTSMQQRFAVRTNDAGVMRSTVDPTHPIKSRVQPQRSPVYSGEERHWDMYPKQQTADRERPFYYRTAGTGNQDWLEANETWDQEPLEREVPANPYIGAPEGQEQYGYTSEDNFYA